MRNVALVAVTFLLALPACAGTSFGRLNAAEAIPRDGSAGGPSPDALKVQMIKPKEWSEQAPKEKLAPTCDARAGAGKPDAAAMGEAQKVIDAFNALRKERPLPPEKGGVTVGDLAGVQREIRLSSFAFTCGEKSAIEISGAAQSFDLAWAVVSPGPEVGVMGISMKDKKVVFVRIALPTESDKKTDPKADARTTVILANVAAYMPADPDEPLVRNNNSKQSAVQYEVLAYGKGATEGFYWIVPVAGLSLGTSLSVGRFKVGEPQ